MTKTNEQTIEELRKRLKEESNSEDNSQDEADAEEVEEENEEEDKGDVNETPKNEKDLPKDGDREAEIERLAGEIAAKQLADIKAKLDKAYGERDEAKKKVREVELARLKEEGKIQEALEMEMSELKEQLSALQSENTGLKRDSVVRDQMKGLEFRNERARDVAYREIVDNLVQDENGTWVASNGNSIESFVSAYASDAENEFLFKVKSNTGAGKHDKTQPKSSKPKSILEMDQSDVLKMARQGQLGFKQ